MFLPPIGRFAKLCGVTSLNDVLLPTEKRGGRAENGAVHKIFRDLLAGKPVSQKRLQKLTDAMVGHWNHEHSQRDAREAATSQEEIGARYTSAKTTAQQASLECWFQIYRHLPEAGYNRTKECLYQLLATTQRTHQMLEKTGISYLAGRCATVKDPTWGPWYAAVAQRLEGKDTIPTDVTEALEALGLLSLAFVWILEAIDRIKLEEPEQRDQLESHLNILFGGPGDIDPKKATARVFRYALHESEFTSKAQFIHAVFGPSESVVREARRYFAGSAIPSFAQTMKALEVGIQMDGADRKGWITYIMIALFIARSSRDLDVLSDKLGSSIELPHIRYAEMMRAILADKPASPVSH
ncbi:hypothetical protein [Thioclava sp. GXIMD4215]|uniref:hypothetical protein n=1 Tax=Thioclava sp. GXIMD4215 TaxID=3131928 RepID=UPI00311B36E2